jgi:hypothetical protein
MITPEDIEFHTPPNADHTWTETNFFALTIPEEHLMATVYTLTRKGVGVMSADVIVYGALTDNRAECLYIDSQQQLPAPAKLSDYSTPSGLRVQAFSPRNYRVDYTGYDDTGIHIDVEGLMEPFDIHDPDHSPKAAKSKDAQHAGSGLGAGYGGHFDMTGHVTGTFKLRGQEYRVDCVETMDHSWGVRPELGVHSMGWMHAHFGKDLAIHWINTLDVDKPVGSQQTLAHGYVLDKGVVYGLTDLKLRCTRVGSVLTAIEAEATDKRGRVWRLHGTADIGAPWICYTSTVVYVAHMRWTLSDGRVGYGIAQENESMQSLTRRRGRRWTERSAHVTS